MDSSSAVVLNATFVPLARFVAMSITSTAQKQLLTKTAFHGFYFTTDNKPKYLPKSQIYLLRKATKVLLY